MSHGSAVSAETLTDSHIEEGATGGDPIYVFVAGGRRLGLPALAIDRLVRAVEIIRVPGGGPCNPGGIHVAGEYVPVLDVGPLFDSGVATGQPHPDHHFILLHWNGTQVALWAHEVCGLVSGGQENNVSHTAIGGANPEWRTLQTLAGPVLVCEPSLLVEACLRGHSPVHMENASQVS